MKYYILSQSSVSFAQDFSRDFYQLSRPSDVADRRDITKFLGSVIVHPTDSRVAVSIPETLLSIHMQADRFGLDPYTVSLVASEREKTRNNITNSMGSRVMPETIFPARIVSDLNTQAEMDADGWFPEVRL